MSSEDSTPYTKRRPGMPADFFAAEVRGLDRIRVDGGPPVPRVLAVAADAITLDRIDERAPSRAAAQTFGRRLATLHAVSADAFGADRDGFIGPLPLANTWTATWGAFYVDRRILPFVQTLDPAQRRAVEAACAAIDDLGGPPERPALIHGDLWSGNLLWGRDGQVWLIDGAAAHFGHRETDLAMLALFGAPHLDAMLSAYEDVSPLAPGWRSRLALHQLHPLLVHAVLFGRGYAARAAAAAEVALR